MGRSPTAKKSAPRDAISKVAQQRLSVLELARELGNVAEACRQRGMDRTSFYEWKRRFQTQGFDGLKDLPPIHRSHPQSTPPEVVEKIKDLALAHPAYRCNRHEAMLALEGIRVLSITIQRILNKNGLGTKIDRWLALEAQNAEKVIEITPEEAAFLEKLNPCFRERHVESSAPGELLSADTFFVGSLKGVGKVYLHAVVDTFGSYAFDFLHVSKQPEAAVAVLHNDVLPFYRNLDLPVKAVLTDNGREFCGTDRHLPRPQRHRTLPNEGEDAEDQRLRRALQRHGPRRVLPGEDARDLLRNRRGAAGRSRRLAEPLQHRAPASGLPQPRPAAYRNRHVIRQSRRLSRQVNVEGTHNLIAAAKEYVPSARLIMASTGFVYNDDGIRPAQEGDEVTPQRDYPASKVAAEKLLRESGLNWSILRFGFVYGEGDGHIGQIPHIAQFLKAHPASRLSMIHHRDIATFFKVGLSGLLDGRIVNTVDDAPTTFAELSEMAGAPMEPSAAPLPNPWWGVLDGSLGRSLGFKPEVATTWQAAREGAL